MMEPNTIAAGGAPRLNLSHPTGTRALRWILVATAALGWWISFDLLRISGNAAPTNPLIAAQCGPSTPEQPSDCRSVLSSSKAYITLDGGMRIPWAAVGAGYFAFVGLWYLFVGIPHRGRSWWHMLIVLVVASGTYNSVQLMGVMSSQLGRWCAGCVAAHLVNGLLLVLTFVAAWVRKADPPRPIARPTNALAAATLTAAGLAFFVHVLMVVLYISGNITGELQRQLTRLVSDPDYVQWRYEREPVVRFPESDDALTRGRADARHTINAFVDLQCPSCAEASQVLTYLVEHYPDEIRVVYRHFPQDAQCNPNPKFALNGHEDACAAAAAVEAARRSFGNDVGLAAMVRCYQHPADVGRRAFVDWADELNVDVTRWQAALDDVAANKACIDADIQMGQRLQLEAMPALFFNGRRIDFWKLESTWTALLGHEVQFPRERAEQRTDHTQP